MVDYSIAESFFQDQHDRLDNELVEFLRIPSVSTDPAHKRDVRDAALWVKKRLRGVGFPFVELIETELHPVVFGKWQTGPDAPTVLLYGHYDVQPPEPLGNWQSPPFEPTRRNGRLYARGVADMKTNMVALIQAIEAIGKSGAGLPVNLLVLFEGEEEMGSPHLPDVVKQRKDQLQADIILSADGGMNFTDLPSLSTSFKGIAACQINVTTGSTDLHSGSYGSTVPNAVQLLVQLLATLHEPGNSVAVDGFYDDVQPVEDVERTRLATIPFDEKRFLTESGSKAIWGESEFSVLERRWKRPTLDINGVWGGFSGTGVKTVTPCEAHAKVTSRLVPNQDPEKILDAIELHLSSHAGEGVDVVVERHAGTAKPFVLDEESAGLRVAREALLAVYGQEPVLVGSGGTVPITDVFKNVLGVGPVSMGFAKPGSGAHAPNEWFQESDIDIARNSYAQFLLRAGRR